MKQLFKCLIQAIIVSVAIAGIVWLLTLRREVSFSVPQAYAANEKAEISPTVGEIKSIVSRYANEYGVNPAVAFWIVQHESQWNPGVVGDNGTSYGLWQIHLVNHPDISRAEALSPTSSTKWAMEEIVAGRITEWSSYRMRQLWYQDPI